MSHIHADARTRRTHAQTRAHTQRDRGTDCARERIFFAHTPYSQRSHPLPWQTQIRQVLRRQTPPEVTPALEFGCDRNTQTGVHTVREIREEEIACERERRHIHKEVIRTSAHMHTPFSQRTHPLPWQTQIRQILGRETSPGLTPTLQYGCNRNGLSECAAHTLGGRGAPSLVVVGGEGGERFGPVPQCGVAVENVAVARTWLALYVCVC